MSIQMKKLSQSWTQLHQAQPPAPMALKLSPPLNPDMQQIDKEDDDDEEIFKNSKYAMAFIQKKNNM
jgi:hypothetical protein